jgi:hypothetical protein
MRKHLNSTRQRSGATFVGVAISVLGGTIALDADVAHAQRLRASALPQPIGKSSGDPQIDALLKGEASRIERTFGVDAELFVFDDGSTPNAMSAARWSSNGFAASVYLGVNLLDFGLRLPNRGKLALAGIMAHEFAHVLQVKGRSTLKGMAEELHADFLAGWYLGRRKGVTAADVEGFARPLFENDARKAGDASAEPDHHGSVEQRLDAILAGFEHRATSLTEAFSRGEAWLATGAVQENRRDGARKKVRGHERERVSAFQAH